MDGTAVKNAFTLFLTKVTKKPYPAKISFYAIIGKDTNLCAISGTGFRKSCLTKLWSGTMLEKERSGRSQIIMKRSGRENRRVVP